METWKKPLWRVPLVLGCAGLLCRALTFILAFAWGTIQRLRGPGPDGTTVLTTGYVTEIIAVISFLLFWWAGWRFVRGLTRREIFLPATIMVLFQTLLLVWEQLSQAIGGFSLWAYRLYALTEGTMWADQLLIRLFDTVSVPVLIPALFAPYLYLLFGKESASR